MKQYQMVSQVIFEKIFKEGSDDLGDIESVNKLATELAKDIDELYQKEHNKTIEYYKKNVYGKENMYIMDPRFKNLIATLTKKETIDINDFMALGALGFNLIQVIK